MGRNTLQSQKRKLHWRRLAVSRRTGIPYGEAIPSPMNISYNDAPITAQVAEPELTIEDVQQETDFKVDGRRVIDVMYFYDQLKKISNHNSPLDCNFSHLKLIGERKKGFHSEFAFHCMMCNQKLNITNCKEPFNNQEFNLNESFVSSFMSIGSGYTSLQHISASLQIPYMSEKYYAKCHAKVCKSWELAKEKCMAEAAKEEFELAKQNGDVNSDGVPMITVVADGCWSKRSYRKNYSALSGAAVIIGYKTKKVLFMAVKNKYCMVCARAANRNMPSQDHICFKNYSGSSSSMESVAISEGFKTSLEMYGIIYSKLIADGDSSTYKKIIDTRPYSNLTVEKIECTNHLLRNYCTKLDELSKDTQHPLRLRKILSKSILRLRRSVTGAVKYRMADENIFDQKIIALKEDFLNGPSHVFGNHSSCQPYYCKHLKSTDDDPEENFIPEMKACSFYTKLMAIHSRLVNNAKSLIYNVNSNIAEVFNSIIAKFVGGKRINYSTRQSYSARCAAAVVAFNTKQPQTYISKNIWYKSPHKLIKCLEVKKREKSLNSKVSRVKRHLKMSVSKQGNSQSELDYGDTCQRPDMNEADFDFAKLQHLKKLSLTHEERKSLERRTVLQSDSMEWIQERRQRLTASIFAKICKRGNIKCGPLVKSLVSEVNLNNIKSIKYGRDHEHIALAQLQRVKSAEGSPCVIEKCGLFVDSEFPYFGASPDGLLGDDMIVEIKCPYSAAGMIVDEAVRQKKVKFWKVDHLGKIVVNKNDDWFYQIQGQLHITQRKACVFAVWTEVDMKVEVIQKDDDFWETKMVEKLKKFYLDCLMPEIVDSRLERKMEIKEPDYIKEAIRKREEKQANKQTNDKATLNDQASSK